MRKQSLTIGIPAYNEDKNIQLLLMNLLEQKQAGYVLTRIIVISDGSTDATVRRAEKVHDERIQVIDSSIRKGKAYRQNQLASLSDSDILVILDADILPENTMVISKLIAPIIQRTADVTSCRRTPLPALDTFEEIINYSSFLKEKIFEQLNKSDNVYLCNGTAIAHTKKLYKKIRWPNSAGNDAYTYLFAKKYGYVFRYVTETSVLYRSPQNAQDHLYQSVRFRTSKTSMSNYFGSEMVNREYTINILLSIREVSKQFIKNPYYFVRFIYLYTRSKAKHLTEHTDMTARQHLWPMVKSSKLLFNPKSTN